MKFMIDSASPQDIAFAMSLGIDAITANATMYKHAGMGKAAFLQMAKSYQPEFYSMEVMGDSVEDMLKEAVSIHETFPDVVIKINFSKEGLQLAKQLHQKGITTAMTLIFTLNQALLAMNAGCAYIFPFLGRNEEAGYDGYSVIKDIVEVCHLQHKHTKIVAASIKNIRQMEQLAKLGVDYAAVPAALLEKAMFHPLTISGAQTFENDWKQVA